MSVDTVRQSGLLLLPVNLLAHVLKELSVPDLCSFAQVSRSCNEAVEKDDLWIPKLSKMGIWQCYQSGHQPLLLNNVPQEYQVSPLTIIMSAEQNATAGDAKATFLKIFRCLFPLYDNIASETTSLFQLYPDIVDQAKILSQLKLFAQYNPLDIDRLNKLSSISQVFENKLFQDFEKSYRNDFSRDSITYGNALVALGRGQCCVKTLTEGLQRDLCDPSEILNDKTGELNLAPLQRSFGEISDSINKLALIVETIFPDTQILPVVCQKLIEHQVSVLFTYVIVRTKSTLTQSYLEAVPSLLLLFLWFVDQLSSSSTKTLHETMKKHFLEIFDMHIEIYMEDEYMEFVKYAKESVAQWNKEIDEADIATETFLMGNITKAEDKNNLMASFRKVLMMPTSVLPFGMPILSQSISTPTFSRDRLSDVESKASFSAGLPFQIFKYNSPTPAPTPDTTPAQKPINFEDTFFSNKTSHLTIPATELDAKMALMNNKLEGIKTLFSLELTLNIIRKGREAIERVSKFVIGGGNLELESKAKCESIFVELVKAVGGVHIKEGFTKALDTLEKYDATSVQKSIVIMGSLKKEEINAIEPLAIFVELVNIGDLIQQMIHMFFEEELATPGFIDRTNFMSPATKEKRKFEKMLDSQVARGLSRGITVLLNQIDYIFLTEQRSSDFCPPRKGLSMGFDTPTPAALKVVHLLKLHTGLLAGSTDKSVIDVFQQEVGARFFGSLCKNIKHQIISVAGAARLSQDLNLYYDLILSLKQKPLMPYFIALKEVGRMYRINGHATTELAEMLCDVQLYKQIFQPEELLEFAQHREDWLQIRKEVQKAMKGLNADCIIM